MIIYIILYIMANNNSYFVTDKEIEELGKRIVSDLYGNRDITELKNNGRQLSGNIASLVERNISGIYSNIAGHRSLQTVLINAIRYSILIEKNMTLDAEFKKVREACERRKNMLNIYIRKLNDDKDNQIYITEIEKITEETKLLETKLNEIAEKNSEPPTIKKNILDLAKKAYRLLLRNDKTAEKLYTAVCNGLSVKLEGDHFGYYQRHDNYNNNYSQNRYNNHSQDRYNSQSQDRYNSQSYRPGYYNRQTEEKKDVYVPPNLQSYRKY
jgi:hypothetical protein